MFRLFIFLVFISSAANAEIFNCDGTWTNQPCASGVLGKIAEVQKAPRDPAVVELDKKKFLITELNNLKFKADRLTKVDHIVSDVITFCQEASVSFSKCSARAQAKIDGITKSMNDYQLAKEQKSTAASEKGKLSDKSITQQPVSVTVIERDSYYDRWYNRLRPGYRPGDHTKPWPGQKPDYHNKPEATPFPPVGRPSKPLKPGSASKG